LSNWLKIAQSGHPVAYLHQNAKNRYKAINIKQAFKISNFEIAMRLPTNLSAVSGFQCDQNARRDT
jgi:hypothetical protein